MDLNKTVIAGRATRDADIRTTTGGAKVASFTIASDGLKDHTNFIPVVCWNKKADFAERFVKRGEKFIISGRLNQRSYEDKEGNKRTMFEIICEDIYFGGMKSDKPMTQAQALNNGRDFVVEDIDSEEVDLSTIPF